MIVKVKEKSTPELRFVDFSEEWKSKRLIKIAKNGFSNGVFNDQKLVGTGYKLVNVKDMYLGDRINVEELTLLDLPESEFKRNKVKYGDIFFTRSSIVKEGIAWSNVMLDERDDVTYDGHLIKMSLDLNEVDPYFFSKVLKTNLLRKQIVARGKTGTMTTIGQDDMSAVVAFYPAKEEQQKIAAFLSSVDNKYNKLHRKRELLETHKRGLMQRIFSQELRFAQDDGTAFPDWEEKTLSDLADRLSIKNTSDSVNRVLTNSAIRGVLDQRDYFDKGIANVNNLEGYYIVEKGDYVYNPRISVHAPVGPISKNKLGQGLMSPLYSIFRFKDKNNEFYEQYFQTKLWHHYMCSVANYGARHDRMNITTSDFMGMPLPYPHPDEQKKIVEFLRVLDERVDAESKKIVSFEAFKKGLLQKMFI